MDTRFYDSHDHESIFNSYLFIYSPNKHLLLTFLFLKLTIYGHTFL